MKKFQFVKKCWGLALLAIAVNFPAAAQDALPGKKLIWSGWAKPFAHEIPQVWQQLDKAPLDGLSLDMAVDPSLPVRGDNTTGNRLAWNVFGTRALKKENFNSQIADLKKAQWKNISTTFLTVAAASYGQDQNLSWFDDARWAVIRNNWKTIVTVARESGCRGILFDPEHYDYGHIGVELFNYEGHNAKRVQKPLAEYEAIARQRGRELMQDVRDIYPDMTMLCYFAYDLALHDDKLTKKPQETRRYALLPAFFDGMLEAAHPRTKWIDCWEFAYGYKQRSQFLEGYHSVRQKAMQYSKVPDLYAAKMRAGFGLMLDYNSGTKWSANEIERNHFSPAQWQNTVQQALEISDEYVIVYTHAHNFITGENLPDAYLQATAQGRRAAHESPEPPLFSVPVEWKTVSAPPSQASAVNLLQGGDFETARAVQETRQPTGWFVQSWDKPVETDDVTRLNGSGIVSNGGRSGKSAYKFIVTDEIYAKFGANTVYRMGILKSSNIAVNADEKLTFSFWYKAADMKGTGDFVVQFHKTGAPTTDKQPLATGARVQFNESRAWREAGPDARIVAQENGWNKVEVRGIVVPAGYKAAQLSLQITGKTPGDYLYCDDVALTRE